MKDQSRAAAESPGTPEAIDFRSPEFNVVDDLNDWAPGCTPYEPLGDVITADMRHQMERRCSRAGADPAEDTAPPDGSGRQAGEPEPPVETPALTVVSHGRTLVVDTDARRAETCAARLEAQGLECAVVLTKAGASPEMGFWGPVHVDSLSVSGAFCGFNATVVLNGDRKPLATLLAERDLPFDLVLDLQPEPSYAGELLPAGYYAPGRQPAGLDGALEEMPQMRGRFVRPQFTVFLADRCIHRRSRRQECRRCLETCPVGAVETVDRKITVNPYVCQGCGACALACPTGAFALLEPPRRERLETVRLALQDGGAGRRQAPVLILSDSYTASVAGDGIIHAGLGQIGHADLELLLAAVAFGAGRVVVACGPQTPSRVRSEVRRQVRMADAALQGLGLPGRTVLMNDGADGAADPILPPAHVFLPAAAEEISGAPDGRTGIRRAVQHLYVQSKRMQPLIGMPGGSPFGAVAVDPARCTLCMACSVACPSGALLAGGDIPRLSFIESRCHQCGLCHEICPEGAMRLVPRILCDPDAVKAPSVLCEAEPFRCVVCGAPFTTQSMLNRMMDRLANHWMYAGDRQRRRLQMCRVCRTRDALISKDATAWNR